MQTYSIYVTLDLMVQADSEEDAKASARDSIRRALDRISNHTRDDQGITRWSSLNVVGED